MTTKVKSLLFEPYMPYPMSGLLPHAPTLRIPRFEPKEPPPWRRGREDKKMELSLLPPVLPAGSYRYYRFAYAGHRYYRPLYRTTTEEVAQCSVYSLDSTATSTPRHRYYHLEETGTTGNAEINTVTRRRPCI